MFLTKQCQTRLIKTRGRILLHGSKHVNGILFRYFVIEFISGAYLRELLTRFDYFLFDILVNWRLNGCLQKIFKSKYLV